VLRCRTRFAVARFGGRNWTIVSAALLLVPTLLAAVVMCVPVIQLVGLAIIATAGTGAPRILLGIYIPLIVVAAVCAATWMDDLTSVRGAFVEAVRHPQTWLTSASSPPLRRRRTPRRRRAVRGARADRCAAGSRSRARPLRRILWLRGS
jgi:nitrate/nitrite transporter NarK